MTSMLDVIEQYVSCSLVVPLLILVSRHLSYLFQFDPKFPGLCDGILINNTEGEGTYGIIIEIQSIKPPGSG